MQKPTSTTLPAIDLSNASFAQLEAYEGKLDSFKSTLQTVKRQRQAEIAAKIKKSADEAHLSLSAIMKLTTANVPAPAVQAQANGNGHKAHTPSKVAKAPAKTVSKSGKVAIKYQDPTNPANTWTGRGMKAGWLAKALKAGAKLEDFRISA